MRLIDADSFCNYVKENCKNNLADLRCELIRRQSTAYDMDKVIEELKELAIEFELFGICSDYVELSHAIDIVKRGGTNAKASEWKVIPGSGGWMIGYFECRNCGYKSDDDKAICPGCGARMKKVK